MDFSKYQDSWWNTSFGKTWIGMYFDEFMAWWTFLITITFGLWGVIKIIELRVKSPGEGNGGRE